MSIDQTSHHNRYLDHIHTRAPSETSPAGPYWQTGPVAGPVLALTSFSCKVAGSCTGLWTEESKVLVPGLKPALDQTVSKTPTLSANMSANWQTAARWPRTRPAPLWTICICASSSLSWLTVHYTCTAVTLTASANGRDWLCANHQLIYCVF